MDLRESKFYHTHVSLELAKHLISAEAKDRNFVFSPLSIHVVLGLIVAGSSGPTQDQLLHFLKSRSTDDLKSLSSHILNVSFADGSPSGAPGLCMANAVCVDQSLPLKPSFKRVADDVYKAAANRVDFRNKPVEEVTNEVNSWVQKETSGLIKEIVPRGSVDATTMLVLANAHYFKGAWLKKFEESKTREHEFHLLNGSSIKVPFMTPSNDIQFASAFDGFKVLCLPYKYKQGIDRRFSMYFFLPDANDGLPALVDKISSEPEFLERHSPDSPGWDEVFGDFLIPKFKISFGFEASQVLKQMGLELPFSGGGLTEMFDSPLSQNLAVSSIFHKSFVDVNEKGTGAAVASDFDEKGTGAAVASDFKEKGTGAAVAIGLFKCFRAYHRLDFVADHPFLFLIREDRSGVVQFIGTVLNPGH